MSEMGTRKLPFGDDVAATVAIKCEPCAVAKSEETKTMLFVNKGIINATFFAAGMPIGNGVIMSDVVDVKVINKGGNPKVVVVYFADGTNEKAVLDESDVYSLEQGISICITKKLLGRNTPHGGSIYNKIIKRALEVMQENEKKRAAQAQAIAAEEKRVNKQIAKKKARKAKLAAMEAERQIEIQKEAYIRAIKALREEDKAEISEAVDEFGKFLENLITEAEKEEQEANNKDTQAKPEDTESKDEEVRQTVSDVNVE